MASDERDRPKAMLVGLIKKQGSRQIDLFYGCRQQGSQDNANSTRKAPKISGQDFLGLPQ